MNKLLRPTTLSLIGIVCVILVALPASLNGQSLFAKINDTNWEGEGSLMNTPTTYKMNWALALDQAFMKLVFENKRMTQDGKAIIFKAHGYYQLKEGTQISGTWFDNRGVTFPLKGTITENELTIIWGDAQTEQGKTVYTLQAKDKMKVVDYILGKEDYVKFSEADYTKQ